MGGAVVGGGAVTTEGRGEVVAAACRATGFDCVAGARRNTTRAAAACFVRRAAAARSFKRCFARRCMLAVDSVTGLVGDVIADARFATL
jgi:hypothetical protein